MKLQVVVDNNTYIDEYFVGEPGLSIYIEEEGQRILLDTGYSDVFMSNAKKLGIDLGKLTHIVLSHGHDDHTKGLSYLLKEYDLVQTMFITHPDGLLPKHYDGENIGSPVDEETIKKSFNYKPSRGPIAITKKLIFLGQIPQSLPFETRRCIGEIKREEWEKDEILEDTALVYRSQKGLFIITGCSHSGIGNIIEYAKKVCHEEKVYGVIGGFHLLETGPRLDETVNYLSQLGLEKIYPCHCVCFKAKAKMNEVLPVEEVGVGLTLEIE